MVNFADPSTYSLVITTLNSHKTVGKEGSRSKVVGTILGYLCFQVVQSLFLDVGFLSWGGREPVGLLK